MFARFLNIPPKDTLDLTPQQILILQEGLNEVLEQENGGNAVDGDTYIKPSAKNIAISDAKAKAKLEAIREKGLYKVNPKTGKKEVDPFKLFGGSRS